MNSRKNDSSAKTKSAQLWLNGRVPNGFWDRVSNKKAYMRWLGVQLGFRRKEDWYQITKQDFHSNFGGGLLANFYEDSPQQAVFDHFPNYDFKRWLFRSAPQGYWQDKKNRIEYMDWLGVKLGLNSLDDWYQVSRSHFHTNRGGGLLANYYGDSVFRALAEYAPRKKWQPWSFHTVPQGFWQDVDNRRAYLRWLGKQLGFTKLSDWYKLNRQHFSDHHGESIFISYYNGSIFNALQDYRPNHNWSREKLRQARR
ncbi:MAG: hypothetical protein JKY95_09620 [Planctomycetaceae bacterium]|nr:hypothetical protein [Planctomycetaceae bacterium]